LTCGSQTALDIAKKVDNQTIIEIIEGMEKSSKLKAETDVIIIDELEQPNCRKKKRRKIQQALVNDSDEDSEANNEQEANQALEEQ